MATFTIGEFNAIREERRELKRQKIRDAIVNAKNTEGWDQMPFDLHKALEDLFNAVGAEDLTRLENEVDAELEKCDHCDLPIKADQPQCMYEEELLHLDCAIEVQEKAYLNS